VIIYKTFPWTSVDWRRRSVPPWIVRTKAGA